MTKKIDLSKNIVGWDIVALAIPQYENEPFQSLFKMDDAVVICSVATKPISRDAEQIDYDARKYGFKLTSALFRKINEELNGKTEQGAN